MKSTTTGAVSGCVVWIIVFSALLMCLLPASIVVGSITSFSQFAIQNTGRFLCPEGTTPESYSYETTSADEFGNRQPATAVELHCVDASGNVVKEDPIVYGFLWIGVFSAVGLLLAGMLAFALAAPAGVLIGRTLERWKSRKNTTVV